MNEHAKALARRVQFPRLDSALELIVHAQARRNAELIEGAVEEATFERKHGVQVVSWPDGTLTATVHEGVAYGHIEWRGWGRGE